MNDKLKDLLTTELRKQIYQFISARSGPFTIAELLSDLKNEDITTDRTTVQQLLQGLIIRKVVSVGKNSSRRDDRRHGRHQNVYSIINDTTPS